MPLGNYLLRAAGASRKKGLKAPLLITVKPPHVLALDDAQLRATF